MRKATLIAGLPGSGKSYLVCSLAENVMNSTICDDPASPTLLLENAGDFTHLFACHPDFCLPGAREKVEETLRGSFPDIDINWIFFANEPDICSMNAAMRDEKPVQKYIRRMTLRYEIPQGADIRPVFNLSARMILK